MTRDKRIGGGNTFASIIIEQLGNLEISAAPDDFFEMAIYNIPNLAITVYTGSNGLDINRWHYTHPIKVAAIPSSFYSSEEVVVTTYDEQLNISYVDNKNDPSFALLAVEANSQLIPINRRTLKTPSGQSFSEAMIAPNTVICEPTNQMINNAIFSAKTSENLIENSRFAFSNPRYNFILASVNNAYIEYSTKDAKNNQIFLCHIPMFKWRFLDSEGGQHADPMFYSFVGIHPNGGGSRTISWSLSGKFTFDLGGGDKAEVTRSFSVSTVKKFDDVDLGGDEVEYCDAANGDGKMYSTGVLDFWMKEREPGDP